MNDQKPKIVVSKCLGMGHCRYDGSMIHCPEVEQLMDYVDFIPVCPEMEIGLPSPRESLRLISVKGDIRLAFSKSGRDMTEEMLRLAAEQQERFKHDPPDGFLLKSRSPSCGIKDVKVYGSVGKTPVLSSRGKGIYALQMMECFPDAMIEDEGRLSNFSIREHFYTAIFSKADFNRIKEKNSIKDLILFHGKNKYLFMAYSQKQLQELGRIVANHDRLETGAVFDAYEACFNKLIQRTPTAGQYMNVMLHLFGYFSKKLQDSEKAYFLDALQRYRNRNIPQSTVMALLLAWAIRFDETYLTQQTIFEPFPKELVNVTDSGKGI